jgi:hypothetical protein
VDLFEFICLAGGAGGEKVSASGEGKYGGAFVLERLVGIPRDVLVCMCRLPIHIE